MQYEARAKILTRLRLIMNKTVENGCTEAEAMMAAAKVSAIMAEHDIVSSELDFKDETYLADTFDLHRSRAHPIHYCAPSVARYTGTRSYFSKPKHGGFKYVFFGMSTDVEIAKYSMQLIYNCMKAEAKEFKKDGAYLFAKSKISARDSFLKGMALSISKRLDDLTLERKKTTTASSGRDLVVVKDQLVDAEYAKIKPATLVTENRKVSIGMPTALDVGIARGKQVNLTTGIGTRSTNALLS